MLCGVRIMRNRSLDSVIQSSNGPFAEIGRGWIARGLLNHWAIRHSPPQTRRHRLTFIHERLAFFRSDPCTRWVPVKKKKRCRVSSVLKNLPFPAKTMGTVNNPHLMLPLLEKGGCLRLSISKRGRPLPPPSN